MKVTLFKRADVYYVKYVNPATGNESRASLHTRDRREAKSLRDEIERELNKALRAPRDSPKISVGELVDRYLLHSEKYYGGSSQHSIVCRAMESLSPYRTLAPHQFGPLKLAEIRDAFATQSLARSTCNKYVGIIKAAFKWAVSQELCDVAAYQALMTVPGLRAGRSSAKEDGKVIPVSREHLEATKAELPKTLRIAVDIQWLTAARPGEILGLRAGDIDRSGDIWTASIAEHKTALRGHDRTLFFCKEAQDLLKPLLLRKKAGEYLFSPKDVMRERRAVKGPGRRPGQLPSPRKTDRTICDRYDAHSYRRAIIRACDKAGILHWHPHQIRHTAATEIREKYGAEAAQVFLGHKEIQVTQLYAEADRRTALRIAEERR